MRKTTQRDTVVGVFEHASDAQRAVQELRSAGYREDQIGVVSHDRDHAEKKTETTETHADTGAVAGVLAGAAGGAAWGLAVIAGLAVPVIGPVIAGGTIAAVLASAGLGAAAAGLAGALIGLGISKEEAEYYETEVKAGRTIVTVKAEDRYDAVAAIMRRYNGHVQERTGEFQRASFASTTTGQHGSTYAAGGKTIERKEEELQAHKQTKHGEVRVRKEVVTEHKTVDVPVEREEVVVERHAASGQPTSSNMQAGEEIRIPVKEEHVSVEKTPVVKEEITVGKRKIKDTEQFSDDVRKEQVHVEREGDVKIRKEDERK